MKNIKLSLSETRLIGKAMHILRILADARTKPQMFPEKDGRVIYSDHFKSKALSKEEILAWQNANDGGLDETRLISEEFDAMIGLLGLVATINHFYEGTENIKATYYCLLVKEGAAELPTCNPAQKEAEIQREKIHPISEPIIFKGTPLDPETIRIICKTIFCIQFFVKKRQFEKNDNPDVFTAEDYNKSKEFYEYDLNELKSLFELLHSNGLLVKITKNNEVRYALTEIPDYIEPVEPVKPIE